MLNKTKTTLIGVAATGLIGLSAQAYGAAPKWAKSGDTLEKCVGVAKKGQNDCGSKSGSHTCSGNAKVDNSPDEWVYTPAGLCKKIGGDVWKTKKI